MGFSFSGKKKTKTGEQDDGEQSQGVTRDSSRGEVGIYPAYCQHTEPITFELRPSGKSISGLDIHVSMLSGGDGQETRAAPFVIKGKKLFTCVISTSEGKVLYSLRQKWALKTHYYAKDAEEAKVLDVKAEKALKMNLTSTFSNAASGQGEQRQFELTTGAYRAVSELREGGTVIATIERPERKTKIWSMTEPLILTVAPKVDTSLVVAICVCMHVQLLNYKAGTLGSVSTAPVAGVSV